MYDCKLSTSSNLILFNFLFLINLGKINKPKNVKKKVELNEKMTIILIEDVSLSMIFLKFKFINWGGATGYPWVTFCLCVSFMSCNIFYDN